MAAGPIMTTPMTDDASDEELSETQIASLLQEAESRLSKAVNATTSSHVTTVLPKLKPGLSKELYIRDHNGIASADPARLLDREQRSLSDADHIAKLPKEKRKAEKDTAGQDWFDIPRTEITPQLKRDLQLINMRSVLDPHRHYKKSGKMTIPQFSQVGTVIEGPTEYYSARINRKDRQKNFVEEAIAGEKESGKYKRKYEEIQNLKRSGKKAHYKALKAKRKGKH